MGAVVPPPVVPLRPIPGREAQPMRGPAGGGVVQDPAPPAPPELPPVPLPHPPARHCPQRGSRFRRSEQAARRCPRPRQLPPRRHPRRRRPRQRCRPTPLSRPPTARRPPTLRRPPRRRCPRDLESRRPPSEAPTPPDPGGGSGRAGRAAGAECHQVRRRGSARRSRAGRARRFHVGRWTFSVPDWAAEPCKQCGGEESSVHLGGSENIVPTVVPAAATGSFV